MSIAANETLAPECGAETAGPSGRICPDEELITLTQATRLLPKVNRSYVAVSTLSRWCQRGMRGAFLDYVRVGRRICTTREALYRFCSELAERDERFPPDTRCRPPFLKRPPVTSRQRQRALAEADAVLQRAGI